MPPGAVEPLEKIIIVTRARRGVCSSAANVHHKAHMDYAKKKDKFCCQYYGTKGLKNGDAARRELLCWTEGNILL